MNVSVGSESLSIEGNVTLDGNSKSGPVSKIIFSDDAGALTLEGSGSISSSSPNIWSIDGLQGDVHYVDSQGAGTEFDLLADGSLVKPETGFSEDVNLTYTVSDGEASTPATAVVHGGVRLLGAMWDVAATGQ